MKQGGPPPIDLRAERTTGADPGLPRGLAEALEAYERAEREQLGLPPARRPQWIERVHRTFARHQRESTTILLSGLTEAHDHLLAAAVRRLGYRVEVLPTPDEESFQEGKAYCDRAMCNPAYFTVGNLLRYLVRLRDEQGLSTEEIVARYVCVTANGCGPCRFGLYVNEYRKALREIGFEGFRVLLFEQTLEATETGEGQGLEITWRLLVQILKGLVLADVVNLLKYRTRPYEREPGATDAAVARSRAALMSALEAGHGLVRALRQVRREFAGVAVDRTRIKPKVAVLGEIWAETTEGDGNYRLPAFLEGEGAEVDIQPLTTWLVTLLWEPRFELKRQVRLWRRYGAAGEAPPRHVWRKLLALHAVTGLIRLMFYGYSRLAGLRGYHIPDIDELADAAHPYYDVEQRGGEMFMEVAKTLHYNAEAGVHLVVSVKPFGCMPSSGVSDGVQSLIADRSPGTLFLPVETTGDGAVNVYSRLQMQLFKANEMAHREAAQALAAAGTREEHVRAWLQRHPRRGNALYRPPHRYACSAANLFRAVGRRAR